MTPMLPKAIREYWNANTAGLPHLWYEYATDEPGPPVSIFKAAGFKYDYGNVGFKLGVYRFDFTIITNTAESAYELGFSKALPLMESFQYPGLFMCNPEPEEMATPSRTGQADVWEYSFSIEFNIQIQTP